MAYREDLDMGKITLISAVSVLVTVALLLFLQVLYYGFLRRQLASSKYNQPDAEMVNYVADQQGQLMSIRVVDRERQIATIPIDTAMELVVTQLKTDPAAGVTGPDDPIPAEQPQPNEANGDEKKPADAGEEAESEVEADAELETEAEAGGGAGVESADDGPGPDAREEDPKDADS
jgi:hypothetical protein